MAKNIYRETLTNKISNSLKNGVTDLNQILLVCESADPIMVNNIRKEEMIKLKLPAYENYDAGITLTQDYIFTQNYLPAPDPSLSQWWFAPAGVNYITSIINSRIIRHIEPKAICIGCPTIAAKISDNIDTTLFDIDDDLINAFTKLDKKNLKAIQYDVRNKFNAKYVKKFEVAIIDPPWYDDDIKLTINIALSALKDNGDLYCTLPGRMTRENIETFRTELIKELVKNDHNIISINHDSVLYQVPHFENIALQKTTDFTAIPWRKGDLIHIQKKGEKTLKVNKKNEPVQFKSFARKNNEFRVFINYEKGLSINLPPEIVENYSESISSRAYKHAPDLWTTSKVGLRISDPKIIEEILLQWADNKTKEYTIDFLIKTKKYSADIAKTTVNNLEKYCELWSTYSAPPILKSPEKILEESKTLLAVIATSTGKRSIAEMTDNFRPQFSRDRDRIIWSNSLRRLADKTQLFPGKSDDTVRRRLTHTLEVMQLAATIGKSLGLNNDLIEAAALAHDLGHTPFGHAGEFAINKVFDEINLNLGGFNHYEHGLDVVNYLESPYQFDPQKSFFGLNLSLEVLEAILKHTYFHDGENKNSSINLQSNSKHAKLIAPGYCHLEGQAVRIADKISYFISDIEDGLRIGAINVSDLLHCRFFHNPILNFFIESNQNGAEQFLAQRATIIKILMEDVILSSTKKISISKINDINSIRNAKEYMITFSPELTKDVNEVWKKLQTNLLFNHGKVISASLFAAKVVSELVILFTLIPKLIDPIYKKNHDPLNGSDYIKYYKNLAGQTISIKKEMHNFMPFHLMIGTKYKAYETINNIPVEDLILAKDYVASLSDYKARFLHKELLTDAIDT
jgi:dGTPase